MYKKAEQLETESENFELPFGGKLAEDNRWVIMAKLASNLWRGDKHPLDPDWILITVFEAPNIAVYFVSIYLDVLRN